MIAVDARKRGLLAALEEISACARDWQETATQNEADALWEKLSRGQLNVVVMGEFKRGKSSLINALLGQKLLPVAAVPLTAVVTVVRGAPNVASFVEFLDGRREEIPPARIVEFVAEERNAKNEKAVDRVTVEAPADFLLGGVTIVDTPGAGSIYRHNTEVAQRYLPHADAVVLVISSDPPISASEVEFLHSIRRWAKKLFVVLNKIDYLEAEDLERSLAFSRKVVNEALGDAQAPLFPVSARQALEGRADGQESLYRRSRLDDFVQALGGFLKQERVDIVVKSVLGRAMNLLERLRMTVELRAAALGSGSAERAAQVKSLKSALEEARRKQYEFSKLFDAELKDHVNGMEEHLYAWTKREAARIVKRIDSLYQEARSQPAPAVREKLNAAYLAEVEEAFSRYLAEEEPQWALAFGGMTDRYLSSTCGLLNAMLGGAAKVFGVEHREIGKPAISVAPPSVWFVLEKVSIWTGGFSSVPTVRLFKPMFLKALKKKIAEAMDVNAGRLRYDYSVRLERSGQEAARAIDDFFASTTAVLSRALEAADSGRAAAASKDRQEYDVIERRRAILAELGETLSAMEIRR